MTEEQARRILGVTVDATMAEIKAAFYAKAKQYHPDVNPDPDATAAFQQVEEAYRILIGRQPAEPAAADRARSDGGADGRQQDAAGRADDLDLIALIRNVLAALGVTILFDGTIRVGSGRRAGYGPDEAAAWLARTPDMGFEELLDEVMIALRRADRKLSVGEVKRALRKIVREDQHDRANFVMRPLLFGKLDAAERARAQAAWSKLVGTAFEGDTALVIAVLEHSIWQVKRKQLDLPVEHHLMPIIMSTIQGTGKTTFVRRFIGVLEELASAPVLLSDLADRRSGDVFRFPITFADDIDPQDPRTVSTLKAVLTATAISRRRLGTSMTDKRPQRSTVIGTANVSVASLIPDPTGYRRFAELQFRNGNAARGGDPEVWAAVQTADYALLWRSVDGHAPPPIRPHLAALAALQDAAAPPDRLRDWLHALDLDSDAVVGITVRGMMVGAEDLQQLFSAQTGEEISNNRFAQRMAVLVGDPQVPFRMKKRLPGRCVYPFKPRAPADSSDGSAGS